MRRAAEREKHWKEMVDEEHKVVTSVAWYLQVELLRTKQVPEYTTMTTMKMSPDFWEGVLKGASTVYHNMYRNMATSKFVVSDIPDNPYNGRIGYIQGYDKNREGYQVIVCPKHSRDVRNGTSMFIRTKYMIPMLKRNTSSELWQKASKLIPKQETCTVDIKNWNQDQPDMKVKFRHVIYERLVAMYGFRENYEVAADTMLRTLSHAFEMADKEEQERIAREKFEHEAAMEAFFKSRVPVTSRPRREDKRSVPSINGKRNVQLRAVLTAKTEHFRSIINGREISCVGDHLFTFPFVTSDNSLLNCSEESSLFNIHGNEGNQDDSLFLDSNEPCPIVITSASMESLSPGNDIDEDVLNFCLNWMTGNTQAMKTFQTNALRVILGSRPGRWLRYFNGIDIFTPNVLLLPYDESGRKSLFVVVGAQNIQDYNKRTFRGSRPCILHFDPCNSSYGKHNSNHIADKIRTWLNAIWRRRESDRSDLVLPFHKRSLPLAKLSCECTFFSRRQLLRRE